MEYNNSTAGGEYIYPPNVIPCGSGIIQDSPRIYYHINWPPFETEPLFKVKLLNPKAKVPTKAYAGDLGWDVYAVAPYTIERGHICMIQTGIAIQPRTGYGYIVKDRSSMSRSQVFTHGGVFDNGFRGEVVIGLTCEDSQYYVNEGDKVAQLVFIPIAFGYPVIVDELDPSERGEQKWGSSGR